MKEVKQLFLFFNTVEDIIWTFSFLSGKYWSQSCISPDRKIFVISDWVTWRIRLIANMLEGYMLG